MSVLASVVSEGSPGSSCWMLGIAMPLLEAPSLAALDRVLGRLLGGLLESLDGADFLCLPLAEFCAVESSASSPDASRDDGCWSSATEDFFITVGKVELRFRFPDPEDDGEDISTW